MINKRGQVTIFIIIAIVIVAAVIIFFAATDAGRKLVNKVIPGLAPSISPEEQLKNCFSDNKDIDTKLNKILSQGGVSNPQNYDVYNNTKIEYLCYTSEYLRTCYIQRPILINNLESEIKKSIKPEIESCIKGVEQSLNEQGYDVSTSGKIGDFTINLVPGKIKINTSYSITAKGKENTYTLKNLEFERNSRAYELIMICASMLNYESVYGNTESMAYMVLYPNVRVEKIQREDGGRIYMLTERDTGERFAFAVRSLVWPAGYSTIK